MSAAFKSFIAEKVSNRKTLNPIESNHLQQEEEVK